MSNSTDFEVRKSILEKLGGDPTGLATIYEVDLAILEKTGGGGLDPVVVDVLPETGESGKMYFVPNPEATEKDNYKEYLWINDVWECVGNASVDLTDYATKEYVDEKIGDINSVLENIING